jgi:ferric-dicitrate binding protein FerR (iron transport regulator)
MSDEYLWDGSGAPDAEVERLEKLLGRFRATPAESGFPAASIAATSPLHTRSRRREWLRIAAAFALLLGSIWLLRALAGRAQWTIAGLEGSPRIDGKIAERNDRWKIGQSLETNGTSRVKLRVDGLGEIEVGPNASLVLLQADATQQQIRLVRGTIRAAVTAPPYVFLVRTPGAYAMDMGCAYTLQVTDAGLSILRVTVGWVDLQHGFRQSLVPAGAAAESRPGVGPGAPYFEDSSERFQDALETVNFDLEDSQARAHALTVLLAEARTRDAFTLLNLFRRVDAEDRGRLYDRLAVLLPPPAGVTRQNAVDGEDMSAWWDKLGLGHVKKGLKGPPRVEE